MKKIIILLFVLITFIIGCDNSVDISNSSSGESDRRNSTLLSDKKQMNVELYFDGEYFTDNHIDSIFYDNEMITMYFMKGIMKYEFYPISKVTGLRIVVEN